MHNKNMKKNNRLTTIITALGLLAGTNMQAQTIPTDPQLRIGTLPNGLTYYIRHNSRTKDRADFFLAQKVGSVLEEENQRGLAHFLEHMAFNGTKNFPGNTLVSELEKRGIKFGSNINASTSYDETIYQLNDIPVTREGIIDTALLVLHDWSGFITLDENEIEKERGVVREEWRTRSSAELRVYETSILPVMYKGSPYADRIPIGSMDVVNNFKPQQLKDYYKKWYRPDLQGVIIVGDIDVDATEAKLKKLFADIPAPVNPAKRIYYPIPNNQEPLIAMATDPEIKNIQYTIYWKKDSYPKEQRSGIQYYHSKLINQMIMSMLGTRSSKLYEKTKQPFSSLFFGLRNYLFVDSKQALILTIDPVDADHAQAALQAGLNEAERLRKYGFSQEEFDDCKKGMITLNKEDLQEPDKTLNYQFVNNYISAFTQNEITAASEWDKNATKAFLQEVTLDMVNKVAKDLVTDSNLVMVSKYPQKDSAKMPTKEAMLNTWAAAKLTKQELYAFHKEDKTLPDVKPIAGKVVHTESAPFGYTQWTLSNGAKVQYKKIDVPEEEVILYGYSPGGFSTLSIEDLPSTKMMGPLTFQQNISDTTHRAKSDLRVDEYDETIAASAHAKKDVAMMLKLTYLKMTTFKKDTAAFERLVEEQWNACRNRIKGPKDIFGDTLRSIMKNDNPRSKVSLLDSSYLPKLDYDKMVKLFQQRYENAGDFIFFIAGTMEEDSMKALVETWLGGLPSTGKHEKVIDHKMYPPAYTVKKHLEVPMKTPQTTVTIGYTGKIAMNVKNRILMQCLSGVLDMIYTDKLREQEGGTYGASVSGQIFKQPSERFIFQVNFDTDPTKKDKLISIVYNELNKIKQQSPKEYVEKVKLHLIKNYQQQVAEKNAEYGATQPYMLYVFGIDQRQEYDKVVATITPEMVCEFAKKIFNSGNLIEVVMDPKK